MKTLRRAQGTYPVFTDPPASGTNFRCSRTAARKAIDRIEIEPDKGGLRGYALLQLFETCGEERYLAQALQTPACSRPISRRATTAGRRGRLWADYRSAKAADAFPET